MEHRAWLLGLFALVAGCGPAGDEWNRAAVSGRITLDGEPLKSGTIMFFPIGGTRGPAAGGDIVDGEYALDAEAGPVVGMNLVQIRSVQKTGRMVESPTAVEADGPHVEGMMVQEYAETVPAHYNTYSKLEREVRSENNQFDFALTSDAEPGGAEANWP
jgi:hypothetical protein